MTNSCSIRSALLTLLMMPPLGFATGAAGAAVAAGFFVAAVVFLAAVATFAAFAAVAFFFGLAFFAAVAFFAAGFFAAAGFLVVVVFFFGEDLVTRPVAVFLARGLDVLALVAPLPLRGLEGSYAILRGLAWPVLERVEPAAGAVAAIVMCCVVPEDELAWSRQKNFGEASKIATRSMLRAATGKMHCGLLYVAYRRARGVCRSGAVAKGSGDELKEESNRSIDLLKDVAVAELLDETR